MTMLFSRMSVEAGATSARHGRQGIGSGNQMTAERFAYSFGLRVDVQLLVDASDVIADGVNADVQQLAGRPVTVSFGK